MSLLLISPFCLASAQEAVGVSTATLDLARINYDRARQAAEKGQWKEFDTLRSKLDDYPLAVYLDYNKLTGYRSSVSPEVASRFLERSADTPLANRYLNSYLRRAGRDRRWSDFLALRPTQPNTIALQCYYFRAKLSTGDKVSAWAGARQLWVHGKSQPKECDPLFKAWIRAGQLTDREVWTRLLAAFDARQRSLLTYVARKGSAQLKPRSDLLLDIYRKPDKLQSVSFNPASPYSADIATHGLAYLARYNPQKALTQWRRLQKQLSFSEQQTHQVERAIALHGLFAQSQAMSPWLHEVLARLGEDKLVELRLRWALADQDWLALTSTLDLLSPARAEGGVWRYWRATALEQAGQAEQAREIYDGLVQDRGYYGFLAADKLRVPYAFNNAAAQPSAAPDSISDITPSLDSITPIDQLPAVARIKELYFHEQARDAHSEWFKLMQNTRVEARESFGSYAFAQGWYRLGIDAANQAKAWDRLDLRFPMAFRDEFDKYASVQKLPSSELMAIARRESAFYPEVNSPVGARGLMQIMPATGKQVASQLRVKHRNDDLYDVDHNVRLGSAYYRHLLDRFSGNRVFALTAYNAGPHRVDRWRRKSAESVPVDIWVETIPYKETRNYVQAVLSYNVVFRHLMGIDYSLLTASELQGEY